MATEVCDSLNRLAALESEGAGRFVHLLDCAVDLGGMICCFSSDKVNIFARFQGEMLTLREVEPIHNRRNDLVNVPIDSGLRRSSGLWREFHLDNPRSSVRWPGQSAVPQRPRN